MAIHEEVLCYEEQEKIEERWMPELSMYKEGLTLMGKRKYRRALDNVERLVVQHLFELTELGISGVGM